MGCGKKCYSLAEAGRVLNLARKNRSRSTFHRDKRPIRRYWCKECNSYHVTSEFKKKRKKTARTIKTILELPHWEEPKDDNERLLTLQYNFLVKGDQSAWLELWQLTENVAGRMLGNMCRKRKLAFTREEWEDKRADAVLYILRRYRTRKDYWIEADYPLQIWYAVKHVLDHVNKRDEIVDYVSGAELDAIIESQNEEV